MKYESTTFNTKKMLAESLKELIRKKSFSKITVRELTQNCGLNRNTFYYHFEDINDLLKWSLEQEAIDVVKHFDLMLDYEEAIGFVLDYIVENEKFLNNIYFSVGQSELKRFFYNDFLEIISSLINQFESQLNLSVADDFKEFLCHFYTEALAGLLTEGITNPSLINKEKMLPYISSVIRSSLPHTLMLYNTKAPRKESMGQMPEN